MLLAFSTAPLDPEEWTPNVVVGHMVIVALVSIAAYGVAMADASWQQLMDLFIRTDWAKVIVRSFALQRAKLAVVTTISQQLVMLFAWLLLSGPAYSADSLEDEEDLDWGGSPVAEAEPAVPPQAEELKSIRVLGAGTMLFDSMLAVLLYVATLMLRLAMDLRVIKPPSSQLGRILLVFVVQGAQFMAMTLLRMCGPLAKQGVDLPSTLVALLWFMPLFSLVLGGIAAILPVKLTMAIQSNAFGGETHLASLLLSNLVNAAAVLWVANVSRHLAGPGGAIWCVAMPPGAALQQGPSVVPLDMKELCADQAGWRAVTLRTLQPLAGAPATALRLLLLTGSVAAILYVSRALLSLKKLLSLLACTVTDGWVGVPRLHSKPEVLRSIKQTIESLYAILLPLVSGEGRGAGGAPTALASGGGGGGGGVGVGGGGGGPVVAVSGGPVVAVSGSPPPPHLTALQPSAEDPTPVSTTAALPLAPGSDLPLAPGSDAGATLTRQASAASTASAAMDAVHAAVGGAVEHASRLGEAVMSSPPVQAAVGAAASGMQRASDAVLSNPAQVYRATAGFLGIALGIKRVMGGKDRFIFSIPAEAKVQMDLDQSVQLGNLRLELRGRRTSTFRGAASTSPGASDAFRSAANRARGSKSFLTGVLAVSEGAVEYMAGLAEQLLTAIMVVPPPELVIATATASPAVVQGGNVAQDLPILGLVEVHVPALVSLLSPSSWASLAAVDDAAQAWGLWTGDGAANLELSLCAVYRDAHDDDASVARHQGNRRVHSGVEFEVELARYAGGLWDTVVPDTKVDPVALIRGHAETLRGAYRALERERQQQLQGGQPAQQEVAQRLQDLATLIGEINDSIDKWGRQDGRGKSPISWEQVLMVLHGGLQVEEAIRQAAAQAGSPDSGWSLMAPASATMRAGTAILQLVIALVASSFLSGGGGSSRGFGRGGFGRGGGGHGGGGGGGGDSLLGQVGDCARQRPAVLVIMAMGALLVQSMSDPEHLVQVAHGTTGLPVGQIRAVLGVSAPPLPFPGHGGSGAVAAAAAGAAAVGAAPAGGLLGPGAVVGAEAAAAVGADRQARLQQAAEQPEPIEADQQADLAGDAAAVAAAAAVKEEEEEDDPANRGDEPAGASDAEPQLRQRLAQ